eukprot:Skav210944  [mRNA]  locus=scaffold713:217009:225122:+ [translate_table: standard]
MSDDKLRTEAYAAAIAQRVASEARVVLDLGTGPFALLATIAARAGARKVYAIERTATAAASARQTVLSEGLEDVISVIEGNSQDVKLPEKVDLIVSELVGNVATGEGVVETIRDARRFLRDELQKDPEAMIPSRCQTAIAPVMYTNHELLAAKGPEFVQRPFKLFSESTDLLFLAKPQLLEDFNLCGGPGADLRENEDLVPRCGRPKRCESLVLRGGVDVSAEAGPSEGSKDPPAEPRGSTEAPQDHVGTEMLVVGLLAEGSGGAKALQQIGVHYTEAAKRELENMVGWGMDIAQVTTCHLLRALLTLSQVECSETGDKATAARTTSVEDEVDLTQTLKFGTDLTQAAREGRLDPLVGRTEELQRTIRILGRRTKNNPVLIGEAPKHREEQRRIQNIQKSQIYHSSCEFGLALWKTCCVIDMLCIISCYIFSNVSLEYIQLSIHRIKFVHRLTICAICTIAVNFEHLQAGVGKTSIARATDCLVSSHQCLPKRRTEVPCKVLELVKCKTQTELPTF